MYRIIDGGNIYRVDTVMDGSVTFSGKATDKPIYSGESVADHYVKNPTLISIDGVISDIKSFTEDEIFSTTEWIERLVGLFNSKRRFILEAIKDSVLTFDNCVIESLEIQNDKTHGRVVFEDGDPVYSFRVSMKVKQLKLATRGRLVAGPDLQSSTSDQKKSSGVNGSPETTTKEFTYLELARQKEKEGGILKRASE